MELSLEQISALAPDASSLAAGKKLGSPKDWRSCGQSELALWGECQGSALYQVKVDLGAFAYNCSCPSRKLPCKHVLGLLLLSASTSHVAAAAAPEWVAAWLAKRAETAQKKEEKQQAAQDKPVDAAAQAKRAARRESSVHDGVAQLDLWMNDLVRAGLAGLERKPLAFWQEQAKRLVDAQAKGLARRVERLSELVSSGRDWPARMLAELGRLALATEAFQHLDALDPALQADVRQIIGWTVDSADVQARGDITSDRWLALGQSVQEEERLRVERNWLLGLSTGRAALVLQFAFGKQPFETAILPGTVIDGDLAFYPSALAQRAQIVARRACEQRFSGQLAAISIDELLSGFAAALAVQPWLESLPAVIGPVRIAPQSTPWLACDNSGAAAPLAGSPHWTLLALCAGKPVELAGVWDGAALTPLGAMIDGNYVAIGSKR